MSSDFSPEPNVIVTLTADLVAAYVGNNSVVSTELPKLITTVHEALTALGTPKPAAPAEKPNPPVSIKKSVTPDYLISMEDGKHYKSLKRHLSGRGMSPAEYREKWGLPHDYPMIAPNYSAQRSALALKLGLGRKRTEPEDVAAPPQPAATGAKASAKAGRPRKTA